MYTQVLEQLILPPGQCLFQLHLYLFQQDNAGSYSEPRGFVVKESLLPDRPACSQIWRWKCDIDIENDIETKTPVFIIQSFILSKKVRELLECINLPKQGS